MTTITLYSNGGPISRKLEARMIEKDIKFELKPNPTDRPFVLAIKDTDKDLTKMYYDYDDALKWIRRM